MNGLRPWFRTPVFTDDRLFGIHAWTGDIRRVGDSRFQISDFRFQMSVRIEASFELFEA